MSSVTPPLYSDGWIDSGHESGAVTVLRGDGDPVMVPFRIYSHYVEPMGTGAATWQNSLYTTNPDRSGSGYYVSVPNGTGNAVRIWVPFFGRCFGVRWYSTQTTPDFTVVVDGEAVKVEGWPIWLTNEGITSQLLDARSALVTHDNLDPRKRHIAQINFVSNPSSSRAWVLFGALLDRRAGYPDPRAYVHAGIPGVLTNAQVAIPLVGGTFQGIRKLIYVNLTLSMKTVTIQNGGVTVTEIVLAAMGATGSTGEFDPGDVISVTSDWTHAASANTAVNYQVIGAY